MPVALLIASVGSAWSQTLNDTFEWTLRSSVTIKADDARQDAAVARLKGSIDAFMPSVSLLQERILSSRLTYSPPIDPPLISGTDRVNRRQPDIQYLQASLPVFDGGRRYNVYRAAKVAVEAGKFVQIDQRQQVLLDAATAYLAILRDRKIVELRRKQVADISAIEKTTRERYETRDATLADADLATSRVLASKVALEQSQADLEASNIEFTRITGEEARKLAPPTVPNALVPKTLEDLKSVLLQDNPRVRAARLDAVGAGFAAKAQIAEVMPQVNLVGLYGRQFNVAEALNTITDSTVKLQMRVPLYEPGAFPRISEARAIARQRSWEAVDGEKRSIAAASTLFVGRLSLVNQISQGAARVRTMQKAVEGFKTEQGAGLRVVIDVLNTRGELTLAQVDQVNLEYLRDRQTFTLVAALARLGPPTPVTPLRVAGFETLAAGPMR